MVLPGERCWVILYVVVLIEPWLNSAAMLMCGRRL
jgi:hypothetical protein